MMDWCTVTSNHWHSVEKSGDTLGYMYLEVSLVFFNLEGIGLLFLSHQRNNYF